MYTLDKKLPASGYRSKGDNSALVLFSLSELACIVTLDQFTWRFNMAVNPKDLTYNAELKILHPFENKKWKTLSVKISDKAIRDLVEVAGDSQFMSLKQEDVFPDISDLDGITVSIDIKSSAGRFQMEDNTFMETEETGIIETKTKQYKTGIHLIRRAIEKALIND